MSFARALAPVVLVVPILLAQQGTDLLERSRAAVVQLYLVPLELRDTAMSVETEFISPEQLVMRTTVHVRPEPASKPSYELLTVYLDFVGERLEFVLAKGPALSLRGVKGTAKPATIAALERISKMKAVSATKDEVRLEGSPEPPYISGRARAVFSEQGVLKLFGAPLPVPESRLDYPHSSKKQLRK